MTYHQIVAHVNQAIPLDYLPETGPESKAFPRRHAPAFSRRQLKNLRKLSGMKRAAKVFWWWRQELYLSLVLSDAGK